MKPKFLFDADDLMLDQLTQENSTGGVLQSFNYDYDNNRNISKFTDNNNGDWTYQYDNRNRLTSAVNNNSGATIKATYTYTYDFADNISTKVEPWNDDFSDGAISDDGWTLSGAAWSVSNGQAVSAPSGTHAFMAVPTTDADQETSLTYSIGATNSSHAINVDARYAGGTNIVYVRFRGDRIDIIQTLNGVTTTLGSNTSFGVVPNTLYKARIVMNGNSLKVYRQPAGGGVEALALSVTTAITTTTQMRFVGLNGGSYTLDDVRILANDLSRTTTYTYNNDNALASYADYNGTVAYGYDSWARPYLQRRTTGGINQDIWFTYGVDGKLIRTDGRTWPGFAKQITDGYSGDGARRSRFVWENDIFTGDYTSYQYSGGFSPVNETHGSDVKTYVAGLAEAKGTSGSVGTYSYYTHDHLGSVRGAYNDAQAAVAKLEYDPFGGPFMTQGGADLTHRFTGHELDPLGMVDGPNMYEYVGGNPINAIDPMGLAAGDWRDPRSYTSVGHELNPLNSVVLSVKPHFRWEMQSLAPSR